MRTAAFCSLLVLCCAVAENHAPVVVGADPSIVGTPQVGDSDNVIRVKVGQPPWLNLAVKDAPEGAVQMWSGPIGEGKIGFYTKDGVGVAIVVPGTSVFRCRLQTPKEGLDEIVDVETTVIVEGTTPGPDPVPVPVDDFPTRLTAAVKAKPEAKLNQVAHTYEAVAGLIKSGSLKAPGDVTAATNIFLTTINSPAWKEISASVVQPHLATLTLVTAGDYEPVWRQIAAAVKAGLTDIPPPVVVDPKPDVTPLPVSGLHVLIVWDKDQAASLPASQVGIRTSTALVDWFTANNVQWRQFYADQDQSQLEQKWKAALAIPRASTPWVVADNGATKRFSGPLPTTEAELITLLEKFK